MTKRIDDGGPAFPSGDCAWEGAPYEPGMSVRDWFAGQALGGICSATRDADYRWCDSYADMAYSLADAMIKRRKKGASH